MIHGDGRRRRRRVRQRNIFNSSRPYLNRLIVVRRQIEGYLRFFCCPERSLGPVQMDSKFAHLLTCHGCKFQSPPLQRNARTDPDPCCTGGAFHRRHTHPHWRELTLAHWTWPIYYFTVLQDIYLSVVDVTVSGEGRKKCGHSNIIIMSCINILCRWILCCELFMGHSEDVLAKSNLDQDNHYRTIVIRTLNLWEEEYPLRPLGSVQGSWLLYGLT